MTALFWFNLKTPKCGLEKDPPMMKERLPEKLEAGMLKIGDFKSNDSPKILSCFVTLCMTLWPFGLFSIHDTRGMSKAFKSSQI